MYEADLIWRFTRTSGTTTAAHLCCFNAISLLLWVMRVLFCVTQTSVLCVRFRLEMRWFAVVGWNIDSRIIRDDRTC